MQEFWHLRGAADLTLPPRQAQRHRAAAVDLQHAESRSAAIHVSKCFSSSRPLWQHATIAADGD
jgi:hypothetical protein